MNLAIVFCTGRVEPRIDWVVDGLEAQAVAGDRITLVVVDALGRSATAIGYRPCAAVGRLVESAPKPNPWQGTHRLTDRDWFALSNARNTGIVLVPDDCDYVAFLDDRSRLGPAWLATVRRGSQRRSVLAGAYEKVESRGDTQVLVRDHRLERAPRGLLNCGGGWLFGCSMAAPLDWLLDVNGLEEGCDGLSSEDVILGLMLVNAGHRVDFAPGMLVSQDRTGPATTTKGGAYAARDKGVSPRDKSHAALARFGSRRRTEFTPDLRDLRRRVARGESWPLPDPDARDWYDGQPIREMRPG